MIDFHPWRALADRPEVEVHLADLPDGILGTTDGEHIWLDRRQQQAQRRSTLTHELEHLERGHAGCQPAAVEAEVEAAAARKLIPLVALAEAIVWACCEAELAQDLWVDPAMVRTRLMNLTREERDYIENVIALREEAL
ncbi:ImmA/IrrE family metallo-endopeptidase [Actinotalea sp. M2MS4P-6]|uniref:ImmA/IrrE family metallo-endopeptidase n=1 Tax=Actinotalea sp. M2MS4P-6 TaxID=2983762 RepID=UPI0021E3FD18|nr:ImmA/IrrE family metallo-endopeptidase [Actinotalea sp. M2MS4P-6]MCV2395968.1 ImmA/IrrE family metallo-endopeptidase [Actinotalea sp. M2MS4P-6]